MATKNNPGAFDCYANAEPDEPIFVLLGRDPAAPAAIARWVTERIGVGKNDRGDPQIVEALECAGDMSEWHRNRNDQKLRRRTLLQLIQIALPCIDRDAAATEDAATRRMIDSVARALREELGLPERETV